MPPQKKSETTTVAEPPEQQAASAVATEPVVKPPEAAPMTSTPAALSSPEKFPPDEDEDEDEEEDEELDSVKGGLDSAVNRAVEEIQRIDRRTLALANRKSKLQAMLGEALQELQRKAGLLPAVTAPVPVVATPVVMSPAPVPVHTSPVPRKPAVAAATPANNDEYVPHAGSKSALIVRYIGDHKQVRTRDIKEYLEDQDKSGNPGVELSRLVVRELIHNVERGMYGLTKKGNEVYRALGGRK